MIANPVRLLYRGTHEIGDPMTPLERNWRSVRAHSAKGEGRSISSRRPGRSRARRELMAAWDTWDVEVSVDPAATLPPDVAAFVADNLGLVARFTAKPTGDASTITFRGP